MSADEVFFVVEAAGDKGRSLCIFYCDDVVVTVMEGSTLAPLFLCGRQGIEIQRTRSGALTLLGGGSVIQLANFDIRLFANNLRDMYQPSTPCFVKGKRCDILVTAQFVLLSGGVHVEWPTKELEIVRFRETLELGGVEAQFDNQDISNQVFIVIETAKRIQYVKAELWRELERRESLAKAERKRQINDLVPESEDEFDDLEKLLLRNSKRNEAAKMNSETQGEDEWLPGPNQANLLPNSNIEVENVRENDCEQPAADANRKDEEIESLIVNVHYAVPAKRKLEICTQTDGVISLTSQPEEFTDSSGLLSLSSGNNPEQRAYQFFAQGIWCYDIHRRMVHLSFSNIDGILFFKTDKRFWRRQTPIAQVLSGEIEPNGLEAFGFADLASRRHLFFGEPGLVASLHSNYDALFYVEE